MTESALSSRRLNVLGGIATASVLALLVVWGAGTTIAGAVIAPGRIEIDVDRQVVQSQNAGIVTNIRVRNGAVVSPGDLLIQLDTANERSELAVVTAQLNEITARKTRLLAERDGLSQLPERSALIAPGAATFQFEGQRRLFDARLERHVNAKDIAQRQTSEIESRISGLSAQKSGLEDQLALVSQEEEIQAHLLDKGLTEAPRLLAIRREIARLQGEIGRITAEIAASRVQIASIEAEMAQMDRVRHETAISDLRDLEFRELELAERREALLTAIERSSVKSPVAGIVHETSVHSLGTFVQPGDILMFVVPNDRPRVASVRVTASQIDQIFLGQSARLRLAAMNPRKSPELEGKVTYISADSVHDPDAGATYFNVKIEPNTASHVQDISGLVPGMNVDAFITADSRAPIAYLTDPLIDYFRRAFRDG